MRRTFAFILCAMLAFSGLTVLIDDGKGAPAENGTPMFSGTGSGTVDDPYVITTVEQLQEMNDALGAYYVLGNDIDASDTVNWNGGEGFLPVGDFDNRFTGRLNGYGKSIINLHINRPGLTYVGLFGYSDNGFLNNSNLLNANITGYNYVGGMVGFSWYSVISNCDGSGSIIGYEYIGGFAGYHSGNSLNSLRFSGNVTGAGRGTAGIIGYGGEYSLDDCHSSGNMSGYQYVGGIAGYTNSVTVTNSSSSASVVATGDYSGGLLARTSTAGQVKNSFSTGDVTGMRFCGGLIGMALTPVYDSYSKGKVIGFQYVAGLIGRNAGLLTNTYSTGSVSGAANFGGLLGYNTGIISDSFWDTETSGQSASAGGTGKTTAEMMQQATFTNWNFTDVWGIDENVSYPYLLAFNPPAGNEYIAHSPIRINSDSDFDASHGVSSGNGTEADPWIISGLDINGTGYGYCLYIANTTDYFIVRNCYLHHASGRPGVYYWNAGISITNLNHGTIFNNTLSNNGWAITGMSVNGNTVSHNNASNNEYGIYIDNCNGNTVSHNTASSNSNTGIYLQSSPNNIIAENTISSNGQNGIRFWSTCNGNTITNNAISFNGVNGFIISDSCYSNTVYHNNFINNSVQAVDTTSGNSWHNGYPSGGNCWSNYAGADADGDGIGDTPHAFTGGQDNYPLMQPYLMMPMVLISGWNLISFPMEQPSIDGAPIRRASDLANQTSAVMISKWNAATQTYINYIPGFHLPTDPQNFAIGSDDAVFVHSSGSQDVSVSGYRSSGQRSVSLAPGWNTVGYHSLDTGDVGTDWAPQVSCGIYDDICYWDGTTFVHYIFSSDTMQLVPGMGYFVWSDVAASLSY